MLYGLVRGALSACLTLCLLSTCLAADAKPLKVLFLGDQGHHQPRQRADQLIPVLAPRGIDITYSEKISELALDNLKKYDALVIYANIEKISPEQESALLEYVATGGGFVPLHCASYCFLNSPAYIDLVGAQFSKHGGEVFATEIIQPDHPIMQGFGGFQSWDETYIHTKHNERNRTVLEVRKQGGQADGQQAEPWTWVRTQGKGRVFYTAWGHDARTWSNPGFHNLVERGIRWAAGRDPGVVPAFRDKSLFAIPALTAQRTDVAPFEYEDVGPKIPNYIPSNRWGTLGENLTKMQKPLPPAESIKHYVTPQKFHLELFVSEPEIQGKPIAINWDHRGRLWICETIDYPNELKDAVEGRDRIRICEDTDGDGRADKFTVFAEQLSIPTTLEFYKDGVIVQAGTETLLLRDKDGDDKADERVKLIGGWAMGDTHGGVSNFIYGLDNRYWAMQGYNDSHPEYARGKHPGFRQGPFNFTMALDKPEVADVEFVRSTTNNSWGLGISEEGLIFASTANRAPSFFVPIPNRYYERVKGWTPSLMADLISDTHMYNKPITDKIRQVDQHGGYTAGAGHALYTARAYPSDWWNHVAFVCGPEAHLVGAFVISPEGGSFRDTNAFNLVSSDDEWAAPIMAEVGPDGHVWIVDWYNYIIQHNPTPQGFETGKGNAYESDLRDKTHGRIYRVVYDDAQPEATRSAQLSVDKPAELVAALKHSNRLWRRHAQRLLVERGQTDVVPELIKLVADQQVDAIDLNVGAIHALWTLKGLGALQQPGSPAFEAAVAALRHPSAGVRRNAALVLPSAKESAMAIADAKLLADPEPQVRLGGLMALADMPEEAAAGNALAAAARDQVNMLDRWLKEGIICAGASQATPLLMSLLTQTDKPADAKVVEGQVEMATVLAEHLARSQPTSAQLISLLKSLSTGDGALAEAMVNGLAQGWPRDFKPELTGELEEALDKLVAKLPLGARGQLVSLASGWGSEKLKKYAEEIIAGLNQSIQDSQKPVDARLEAVKQLLQISGGTDEVIAGLVEMLTPQNPPQLTSGIVHSLSSVKSAKIAAALIGRWAALTPKLRDDAVATMLVRPESARQLVDALSKGPITIQDLTLDQRQTLKNHPDRSLRDAATKVLAASGGLPSADRVKVIERYMATTHAKGDATIGKELFKKACANCHKHSGEGQEIGPDLTGMAVHPKEELLVHILDPSRSVEGNFRRYTVLTTDNKVIAGMLAAESLSAIEIIDAEGKKQSISRDDIEAITATNKSLMPEGLEETLKEPDMTNLLEFLTSKGRFVPLPLATVATAISTKGLFHDGDNGPDRMIFANWKPKTFQDVPFQLVDPQGKSRANIVMLYGPQGTVPPKMPRSVKLPCNMPVGKLHMLGGVSGWGYPASKEGSTTMIVKFHFADGKTEEHKLINGEHFADYIRRIDVPKSTFAFDLRGQQVRYLAIEPTSKEVVKEVELLKGDDNSAPMVLALTAEQP